MDKLESSPLSTFDLSPPLRPFSLFQQSCLNPFRDDDLHRQGAQAGQPSQIDSANAGLIGLTLQLQANFGRTYFQSSALLKNLVKIQFGLELFKLWPEGQKGTGRAAGFRAVILSCREKSRDICRLFRTSRDFSRSAHQS